MKKTSFVLMTFLSFSIIYSDESSMKEEYDFTVKSNQATDEYEQFSNDEEYQLSAEENAELEYEQYICDTVKPPKPSALMVLLTNIGCTVFVHYIYFKEKLETYYERLRDTMAQWFCMRLQQNKKAQCGKKMVS